MRLLLLLSFLGFGSVVSVDPSSTPLTTKAPDTNITLKYQQNQNLGTTMAKSTTDSKGAFVENNNASTSASNESPTAAPPSTGQGIDPKGTMRIPSKTQDLSASSTTTSTLPILISHIPTTPQNNVINATTGSGSSSIVTNPESKSKITSTPRESPTQMSQESTELMTNSISKPTSEPIQRTSTERKTGVSNETVTSAAGNTQITTANEILKNDTKVNNITDMMEKNATRGAFTDVTGSMEKSTASGTQINTTDVVQTSETSETATEVFPKEKTPKPEGNKTISSEAYCVAESKNQNYSLIIKNNMDCETFVKEKGKALAEHVCSKLTRDITLKGFKKCELQFSFGKEQQSKLMMDISFKVNDDHMNSALQWVKAELEELKQQHEGSKERQSASELKKLIAMVVTGSLLLLIFLSAIVYRCSQRKSKHKDPYLTEELHTVDNGCHDNPAMDSTERESEMEEKNNSKATFLENTDGWIVPLDTHIKDDGEEEDTHL